MNVIHSTLQTSFDVLLNYFSNVSECYMINWASLASDVSLALSFFPLSNHNRDAFFPLIPSLMIFGLIFDQMHDPPFPHLLFCSKVTWYLQCKTWVNLSFSKKMGQTR